MLCCISDFLLDRDKVFVLIGVITAFYKYHQRLDPDCCCLITVKGPDRTPGLSYTGTKHNHQGPGIEEGNHSLNCLTQKTRFSKKQKP